MVGEDQKNEFQYLLRYNGKPAKTTGNIIYNFDKLTVISRQESGDKYANEAGPRATPMRDILKDPEATYEQKFDLWRSSMPSKLDDGEVEHYMQLAAERMGFPVEQGLDEADNPNNGGAGMGSQSAIPGTPTDLSTNEPTPRERKIAAINNRNTEKFMGH